ncbi:myelin transcription factor [Rhynchospora pubera]|uniref:Myelin transcription factor n=1 Tax=Rhynchospora pubera TaxID=906938 RepID=A0AAV8EHT6_9POAL|nr:myelin transcription factor [Rhynchospora pubera]
MATLVRRPLQPKNLNTLPSLEAPPKKPKKINQNTTTIQPLIQDNTRKETCPIEPSICKEVAKEETGDDELREASLAEELEIVRKRRERLRQEKEKTEMLLKERDLVLEKAMKEMERRAEEQNSIELEIYKVILLKDLRNSSMRVYPVQSLRMKEEEKKSRELSEGFQSVKTLRQKEEERKSREALSEASSTF